MYLLGRSSTLCVTGSCPRSCTGEQLKQPLSSSEWGKCGKLYWWLGYIWISVEFDWFVEMLKS